MCWVAGTFLFVIPTIGIIRRRLLTFRGFRSYRLTGSQWFPFSRYSFVWFEKLDEALQLANWGISVGSLLALTAVLFVLAYVGVEVMNGQLQSLYAIDADLLIDSSNPLLALVFATLIGTSPMFYMLFRVQRNRQKMGLAMIDVVQNLIGTYGGNLTVGEWIYKSERTMPIIIRSEWARLGLDIRTRGAKEALYNFSRRMNNDWAEDLADIMLVGAENGLDLSKSLHKLVRDMQTARSNEQKRQAMISVYRLGTIFMVFAAFFVIGFNIHADGNNYRYYFLQPMGRAIVIISIIVLFASIMAVVFSGRRNV